MGRPGLNRPLQVLPGHPARTGGGGLHRRRGPLARPSLAAVGIFTFIASWNNFLWPYVGRSTAITGPYTDSTGKPLLEGGGHWLAYHYDAEDSGTPKLGLNKLNWKKNGWPIVL
jgi:hypothetical protein